MPYDEGLAEIMRSELAAMEGITERKMFGGLCFQLHGNMVCGVHKDGGMARVGKEREEEALKIDGVAPLSFTGRKMGGLVDVTDDLLADDTRRATLMTLAMEFVAAQKPK